MFRLSHTLPPHTTQHNAQFTSPHSTIHSTIHPTQKGEVIVDQAHRGYNMADDSGGYRSVNPLFMKYTPTNGRFSGQLGYGYRWVPGMWGRVREGGSGVELGRMGVCVYLGVGLGRVEEEWVVGVWDVVGWVGSGWVGVEVEKRAILCIVNNWPFNFSPIISGWAFS